MLVTIPTSRIRPNPFQPLSRQTPDPAYIEELAADIVQHGLLSPPSGRVMLEGEVQAAFDAEVFRPWFAEHPAAVVELVFGHHRVAAFRLLDARQGGYYHIPVNLAPYTDAEMARLSYAENTKRRDLNPLENALSIQAMLTRFNWTQSGLANRLSLARSTIANCLRLLDLIGTPAGDALLAGQITERQAVALLPLYTLPEPARAFLSEKIESWRTTTYASELIASAIAGASSDNLRERLAVLLQSCAAKLTDAPWPLDEEWNQFPDNPHIRPNACRVCPARWPHGNLCCDLTCHRQRHHVLDTRAKQEELDQARALTGLPLLSGGYTNLYGHEEIAANGCPHQRLALAYGYGGAPVPGMEWSRVRVVCSRGPCLCMKAAVAACSPPDTGNAKPLPVSPRSAESTDTGTPMPVAPASAESVMAALSPILNSLITAADSHAAIWQTFLQFQFGFTIPLRSAFLSLLVDMVEEHGFENAAEFAESWREVYTQIVMSRPSKENLS